MEATVDNDYDLHGLNSENEENDEDYHDEDDELLYGDIEGTNETMGAPISTNKSRASIHSVPAEIPTNHSIVAPTLTNTATSEDSNFVNGRKVTATNQYSGKPEKIRSSGVASNISQKVKQN